MPALLQLVTRYINSTLFSLDSSRNQLSLNRSVSINLLLIISPFIMISAITRCRVLLISALILHSLHLTFLGRKKSTRKNVEKNNIFLIFFVDKNFKVFYAVFIKETKTKKRKNKMKMPSRKEIMDVLKSKFSNTKNFSVRKSSNGRAYIVAILSSSININDVRDALSCFTFEAMYCGKPIMATHTMIYYDYDN